MKPRDFPTGRAVYGGDEPAVIDMSLDGPKEAGANTRSPSLTPNYEREEEAEMMMAEAEADKVEVDSPKYVALVSQSPSWERSPVRPVLNAYFTQNFRPKRVYGPRPSPQVTPSTLAERKKRKQDKVKRDQKQQDQGSSGSHNQVSSRPQDQEPSRKDGCQEQGAPGIRQARAWARNGFVTAGPVKLSQGEN